MCVCVSEWDIWTSLGCCKCHLPPLCALGESLTSANLSVLICKTGNDTFVIRINWEGTHMAIYDVLHNCGFLRRILVILDALHSHIHFRNSLSISVKNCAGLALCSSGENWNIYHIVFSAQERGIFFLDLVFTSFQECLKGLEHLLLYPFPEQSIVLVYGFCSSQVCLVAKISNSKINTCGKKFESPNAHFRLRSDKVGCCVLVPALVL